MKKVIILLVVILLTSCGTLDYIQIFKTSYENGQAIGKAIVFEDKNCVVSYNLWASGGNAGFNIFNKSDKDITINLRKTFFVLNGVAYEYYQNRTFTSSSDIGSTVTALNYSNYLNPYSWYSNVAEVTGTSTTSTGVSYVEKSELTIPPKTSINIAEYKINVSRFDQCKFDPYPSGKQKPNLQFEETNSPFVFSNIITYTINNETSRLETKFYVNEIQNFPYGKMVDVIDTNECGEPVYGYEEVIKDATPNKFYIKYQKGFR
jgi:hypothetical protein